MMKFKIKPNCIKMSVMLYSFLLFSCEPFVDVDVPDHKIVDQTVYANDETAIRAMAGIYNQLFNTSFSAGGNRSVTLLSGLSADNFRTTTSIDQYLEFEQNEIIVANSFNLDLWAGAYNIVYMTNAVLEGIKSSESLTSDVSSRLTGEARFVRAFTYFYLVNLYGDVPLLLTTDYRVNAIAPRNNIEEVYQQIIADLEDAINTLDDIYVDGDRTRPTKYTAMALLARVHLYLENWALSEEYSSRVIAQTHIYTLLKDLDLIFLANSREAIWQISPIGKGSSLVHTNEGNLFIRTPTSSTPVILSDDFMKSWDVEDKRFIHWVGSITDNDETYYFPYKYKIQYDNSGGNITEYSMVLRLAEQYLIRAEARARLGNSAGAMADLDVLRERAGLERIADTTPNISEEELLDLILKERRAELFAEWGHRWLDLKRTDKGTAVLSAWSSDWQTTDVLYPIPEDERMKNPNLGQNIGY